MKKPADVNINLVPKDPFFETPMGKVLQWSLSVGRYIVIFTELIVIISFITRFSLDRQVTDLNESIYQKQTIINSYGDLEANLKEAQQKIEQYKQISQQSNIAEVFPKLSAITPTSIRLDELTIKTETINLAGTAYSNSALSLLINNLQLSPDFFNVSIDKIETGDSKDPGFHFQIHARTSEAILKQTPATNVPEEENILDRTQGL